jgi:hypothetical protein
VHNPWLPAETDVHAPPDHRRAATPGRAGHSYSGAVITEAASHEKVAGPFGITYPAAAGYGARLFLDTAAAGDRAGLVLADPAGPGDRGDRAGFVLADPAAAGDGAGFVLGDPAAAEHRAPRLG